MKEKREWEIIYYGKGFSLNDFYSQGHYSKRVKIKNDYSERFRRLIDKAGVREIDQYKLVCYYNSFHDPSNVSGMAKVFEDTLAGNPNRKTKEVKFPPLIKGDDKRFCKGFCIFPDEDLKHNTFKFIIKEI